MSDSNRFDEEVDVVVVGSGAGGFSSAVTAANNGQRVVLLEKAARIGGTTRSRTGTATRIRRTWRERQA